MTNEEAWDEIDVIITKHEIDDEFVTITREQGYEALRVAREALELPSPAEVLAAVREEIKSLSNANPSYWYSADLVAREDVFDIIDKHMEELE